MLGELKTAQKSYAGEVQGQINIPVLQLLTSRMCTYLLELPHTGLVLWPVSTTWQRSECCIPTDRVAPSVD